jgi:uncharacterized membrane protein YfcA
VSIYVFSFLATLLLSTLFATGGMGSAIVLIPVLGFLGFDFNLAKAAGLFVNTVTTSTASVLNWRRRELDCRLLLPNVLSSVLTAPLGAWCAQIWDMDRIKLTFALFLFLMAVLMFRKRVMHQPRIEFGRWFLVPLGLGVGFLAGLLGIGGGALIVPFLYTMRFSPREIAVSLSFMIPFSTLSAFASYTAFITVDWTLIAVATMGAVLGGFTGNRIMHTRLGDTNIRYILAITLCLVAVKMLFDLAGS